MRRAEGGVRTSRCLPGISRVYACLGRSGLFSEANFFDQGASNVPDRDVSFLDALRVTGRHVQQQIDFIGERTACFAGQRHAEGAAARSGLDAAHDVWTRTARGYGHEDVPEFYERFNL